MKQNIFSLPFLTILFTLAIPLHAQANTTICNSSGGDLYSWIRKRIEASQYSKILPLSCHGLKTIEDYVDEDIQLTSGRKRGKYIICLSNNTKSPCLHQIAELIGYEAPSVLINRIFGAAQTKSEYLNETVERLFLKPSKLIKRIGQQ